MKKGYKAAIIGFGGMGQRHYAAYQQIGVNVVAICDWDRKKINQILPDYPEKHTYDNYERVIKNEDLDIISVVTNGPTHAEIVIQAAEAGIKNILCEKPMATNLRDAQKVIEVCHKHKSRLAVNHIRRWSPNHKKLKLLLDEGVIGDLRHIYFHCGSTGLGNLGIHAFDNMRFYTDSEVEWVIGFTDKTGTPNPRGPQFVDPGGYGILHFQNGVRAFIDTSEDTGVRHILELVGRWGRVIIEEWGNSWKAFARSDADRKSPLTRYILPMEEIPFELEAEFDIPGLTCLAIKELLEGGDISCDGEVAKRALEIVIAFHISDATGNQKIYLPLTGEALDKDIPIA